MEIKMLHSLGKLVKKAFFIIYVIQITQTSVMSCNKSRVFTSENDSSKPPPKSEMNSSVLYTSNINGQEVVFRVLNGEPVEIGEIPYQVALMKKKTYNTYLTVCGGTIIHPNKVLTAAHCVQGRRLSDCTKGHRNSYDLSNFRIVAGQLRSQAIYGEEGQWRKIKRARYPRKFKFPRKDIAVMYTYKSFIYNDAVQPIPYASKLIDYGSMVCLASGYGRVDAKYQSSILLKAHLTVLPMDICNLVHEEDFSKLVCTSDFFSDLHKGDSGGPLVCKNTTDPAEQGSTRGIVVGAVSGKAMDRRMSTFFTRVSAYHKFISSSSEMKASSGFLCVNLIISIKLLRSQF